MRLTKQLCEMYDCDPIELDALIKRFQIGLGRDRNARDMAEAGDRSFVEFVRDQKFRKIDVKFHVTALRNEVEQRLAVTEAEIERPRIKKVYWVSC